MLKITYKNFEGIMNIDTEEVMFFHFKYRSILEAINRLENDIISNKKEIEIFNDLIGDLLISD